MSITRSICIPEDGVIYLDLGGYINEQEEKDVSSIGIRYKGKQKSIEERNYQIEEYYPMTNDHVMYDIKHRMYTTPDSTRTTDEFYIINTNIIIRIIKILQERITYLLDIDLNGMTMYFYINNKRTYDELITNFKMAIAEIVKKHLNIVNIANFRHSNSIKGLIGTFLTGHNRSIVEQRRIIQQRQQELELQKQQLENELNIERGPRNNFGGQRKSRKSRKSHKK
jgi:hypothetical protein